MLQINKQKQHKSSNVDTDSENGSDKTKDTLYQVSTDSIFKFIEHKIQNSVEHVTNAPKILTNLCEGTYTSDRILRLISSIIKVLKNLQLLKTTTIFDKLTTQITQLRRLVRINRVCIILKQYLTFIKKKDRKKRDIFDILFKTVMLCTDINDLLTYFMQLNIIKQRNIQALRKNVANLYFCQCILWLCFHVWDYFMKDKTDEEKRNRINNIYKYILDTILSHNDFSLRQVTFGIKSMSLLGMLSSLFGLGLIWK